MSVCLPVVPMHHKSMIMQAAIRHNQNPLGGSKFSANTESVLNTKIEGQFFRDHIEYQITPKKLIKLKSHDI
jgi:hypothetical protein